MNLGLFFLPIFFIGAFSDEVFDGYIKLVVEHTLDDSPDPTYSKRGVININALRAGKAEMYQEASFSQQEFNKLKELALKDDIYRIRVARVNEDGSLSNYVHSFTKACSLVESGLKNAMTVHLDGGGTLIGVFLNTNLKYCEGKLFEGRSSLSFETSVDVQVSLPGPMPDTESYVKKLELEKQQAMGQHTDNRSFLAKYWMYIVPFIIILMIVNNADPGTPQRGA